MFAKEAVLVVEAYPHLYGFSIESSYFGPYLLLALENRVAELDEHKARIFRFVLKFCNSSCHTILTIIKR